MTNRVFVTGLGALTASGYTLEETWQAILQGQSALGEVTQWDLHDWPCRLGGELKDFQPARMLPDRKLMKVISRQDVMGINAAVQAIEHSGVMNHPDENTGVYVGSPGNKYFQQYDFIPLLAKTQGNMQAFAQQLFDEVHPMWLLRILPNNVLAYTGITYGFKGPNHNIANHAVGGTQAIIEAYNAIKHGQAERAVVVAYDMGIEPQALFYYDKLGVVSYQHLKPFDKQHDGTLLAEGAAALVLESEASATQRSATCYGEILAGLSASEAAGLFSIEDDAKQLQRLIQKTLQQAALSSEEIDCVVAHGNGNKKSDDTEALAIQQVLGEQTPVTAFKWAMGHTLCASGVLDAALTIKSLQTNSLPGIAVLDEKSSSCPINVSANTRTLEKQSTALMINRGFASMNACVVIKSCE